MSVHRSRIARAAAVAAVVGVAAACAPIEPVPAPMGVQPGPAFAADHMYAETQALFTGTLEGARFALDHTQDEALRTYAQRVIDDFTAAEQRFGPLMQRHGITAQPGASTEALTTRFRETGEALRGFEGREFDERYLDHQIAMNRWLLDAIDRSYMPAARGRADVQRELTTLRTTVQQHLAEAERIRAGWR